MRTRRNHINMAVIILALVFCMAVLGGAGYFVYTNKAVEVQLPQLEPEARVQSGTLHDPAGRQAELDDMVREGMLTFSINATPVMENGRAEANLLIENPPDPEQYIESVPLDRELPAGEYPCLAYIDAYRISDSAYIGRATARITLFVQN